MARAVDCFECGQSFIDSADSSEYPVCIDCQQKVAERTAKASADNKKKAAVAAHKRAVDLVRWICPYCDAITQIRRQAVGHVFSCPTCEAVSAVVDADAESRVEADMKRQAEFVEAVASGRMSSVTCSTVLIALAMVFQLVAGALSMAPGLDTIALVVMFISSLVVFAALISALFDGINEIHRCRKLLEMIASKKGA